MKYSRRNVAVAVWAFGFFSVLAVAAQQDTHLDAQIKTIAAAHHGEVALYAHNLRTGQTASLLPDEPVQTASVIKMGILLDAAEQIRAGRATLDERVALTKVNQVEGSGVLGELTPPLALTLGDVLTLMVVLSDNTATNMAIDRLGLAHINETLRAAGLHQTVLYKKVYVPATEPMPPDQPKFGLGKTTAREMASIMERIAACHLALDDSAPLAADGKSAAPFSACCAVSRIATACRAISRRSIPAKPARPSATRQALSTRCAMTWPSSPQNPVPW